jgi:hypothetical protein
MGEGPKIRPSVPVRAQKIPDSTSIATFEVLRSMLPKWRRIDLRPLPAHLEPLRVEVCGTGFKAIGLPDVPVKIIKPLSIDSQGLHARFGVDAQHITQVLGKNLRLIPIIAGSNPGVRLAPIERSFNDKGEAVIDIPLGNLLSALPKTPLPLEHGRLWPPKQYQITIVPYNFIEVLPR